MAFAHQHSAPLIINNHYVRYNCCIHCTPSTVVYFCKTY